MKAGMCGWTWLVVVCLLNGRPAGASEWNKEEWEKMFKEGGALGRIALRIVDDKGAPVPGARVVGEFYSTPKQARVEGRTDDQGVVPLEGRTISDVKFTISKDAYYDTNQSYDFIKKAASKADAIREGKWMPWSPTVTMTLKKVRNPVPMFARIVGSVPIPCDQTVGYDLEIGDVVQPFGKGLHSDLEFLVMRKKNVYGRDSYSWKCSASSTTDGIQVLQKDAWSRFPSVYEAPDGGYQREYAPPESLGRDSEQSNEPRPSYLVFRVRSQADSSGKITSANYGKMNSPVIADGSSDKGCRLSFWYWFNPDGTRNLESDPSKNMGTKRRRGDDLLYQP